ncbi:hypothetical protein ASD11_13845 [Aeromicrobium sp. Root495]|uniref:GNAT family N-acetyltransferase n=1 Tax=Aeromicrobium sp. Root495 TaxID=1736550 RepID=UPI0006FF8D6E|nr:GNAT family N-acetyltransferase [Aeromicrobium sp. Root495]KQY60520.1 hypothetical protein ASD11_13845 [Aeromicrobium sp. Root495]
MSWAALHRGDHVQVADSPVESARFGVSIARVLVPEEAEADAAFATVRETLSEHSADVIVLRYPARHVRWFADLLSTGRELIHADTLDFWDRALDEVRDPDYAPYVLDESPSPEDVGAISAPMFDEYPNHYAANPRLDVSRLGAGFAEWATTLAGAGPTGVLRAEDGDPAGYYTVALHGEVAEWVLGGVTAGHRGRGVYPRLMVGAERAAAQAGASRLIVSTQVQNLPVRRFYARLGMTPLSAFLTVHAVRSDRSDRSATR